RDLLPQTEALYAQGDAGLGGSSVQQRRYAAHCHLVFSHIAHDCNRGGVGAGPWSPGAGEPERLEAESVEGGNKPDRVPALLNGATVLHDHVHLVLALIERGGAYPRLGCAHSHVSDVPFRRALPTLARAVDENYRAVLKRLQPAQARETRSPR